MQEYMGNISRENQRKNQKEMLEIKNRIEMKIALMAKG